MSDRDAIGSLMRHAARAVCLTLILVAPARAQGPIEPEIAPPSPSPDFLTRYDFHLSTAALSSSDPRFAWEAHFGGDLDIVDYGVGRATILADYEALLGNQFRPFDPYQGNYTLEAAASARVAGTEVQGLFHHESRHLGDRPKRFAVAWNVLGVRLLRRLELGDQQLDIRATAGRLVQQSFVDYDWTADLDLLVRRPISDRVGVFGRAYGQVFTVDGSRPTRGTQYGGRLEAGVRLKGRAGAIELFGGVERRIDADQVELEPERWALVGFRILSK